MRPIIIDMQDMSDSAEVYETKPNPILTGFIYLILTMVVVALVWMYFCKIDIVVKGSGTVAAAEEVSTITNRVAGVITGRKIEDGQEVKAGEILYTVSHEEQSLQLETLEQQLADYEERKEMLKAYEAWLEKGEEFPVDLADNQYYSEMSSRKRLLELGKESALQAYSGEVAGYTAKMDANAGMLAYYSASMTKSRQLIEAIKNRKNSFSSEESYYWNIVENYLVQYQQIINQYSDKINELQKQSDAAEKEIETLEKKKLIVQEKQQNAELRITSVSGGDADLLTSLQQELQMLETQLASEQAIKKATDSSISRYHAEKESALNAYEKENIAAIETSILGYEQNIAAYEGTQQEYMKGQNILIEQGTEVELSNLLTQEKHSVAGELDNCRQSCEQLIGQIQSLEQNIENATVKASVDGRVNFVTDLVEGDYIASGTQVLSIIPNTGASAFVVKSYVENKDIAKIHEGMEVTYEIGAYPSREYGTMRGEVTFVSADLKVNNNGSAYYIVETSVDAGEFRNRAGEEAKLKVGMQCETKVVVEEKPVLGVLVEKLFHIAY